MPEPQFELLSGAIDGANADFYTSVPYTPGSVAVYLNGQLLLNRTGNPWTETDPATGQITVHAVDHVLRPGDEIAAFYLDTTTAPDQVVIDDLVGVVSDTEDRLTGILVGEDELVGTVADEERLEGQVATEDALAGTVADEDALVGILEEC